MIYRIVLSNVVHIFAENLKPTPMKKNLRKLHLINLYVVSIDNFYAITIYEGSITLQGKFNPALIVKLSKLFKFTFGINGYAIASSHNIDITFTN